MFVAMPRKFENYCILDIFGYEFNCDASTKIEV